MFIHRHNPRTQRIARQHLCPRLDYGSVLNLLLLYAQTSRHLMNYPSIVSYFFNFEPNNSDQYLLTHSTNYSHFSLDQEFVFTDGRAGVTERHYLLLFFWPTSTKPVGTKTLNI